MARDDKRAKKQASPQVCTRGAPRPHHSIFILLWSLLFALHWSHFHPGLLKHRGDKCPQFHTDHNPMLFLNYHHLRSHGYTHLYHCKTQPKRVCSCQPIRQSTADKQAGVNFNVRSLEQSPQSWTDATPLLLCRNEHCPCRTTALQVRPSHKAQTQGSHTFAVLRQGLTM